MWDCVTSQLQRPDDDLKYTGDLARDAANREFQTIKRLASWILYRTMSNL